MMVPVPILEDERVAILCGDAEALDLGENTIDALCFDPPAGIAFMGAAWDRDRGGADAWSAWLAKQLAPAFRALKPGGHALSWALPRTSHWTARALELAGFEIRDVHHDIIAADAGVSEFLDSLDTVQRAALMRLLENGSPGAAIFYQVFGTGFPKSLDISKAIDEKLGAQREIVGPNPNSRPNMVGARAVVLSPRVDAPLTIPATAAAARWAGWGTALKPAVEHWILARKPLDGTYAANVLAHGTGAINVDACRIAGVAESSRPADAEDNGDRGFYAPGTNQKRSSVPGGKRAPGGRWPAHLTLAHADECEPIGEATETRSTYENTEHAHRDGDESTNFAMRKQATTTTTTTPVYRCALGCPVAELDAQSGVRKSGARRAGVRQGRRNGQTFGDQRGDGGPEISSSGTASRFFYVSKPSRREKDAGLDHLAPATGGEATGREDDSAGTRNPRAGAGRTGGARNVHPTSKGVELMSWLLRLITPPGGIVLDMFAGSGTTGVAAIAEGFGFVGVEQGGPCAVAGCRLERDEHVDDTGHEYDPKYLPILLGRIRHAVASKRSV